MNVKTLTPTQLWTDYDPDKYSPELNITDVKNENGVCELSFMFSAYLGGGKTRAAAKVIYKPSAGKIPVIIQIGGSDVIDIKRFTDNGFAVIDCDYLGKRGTVYHESIAYAESGKEGEHLTAKLGADSSAVFVRSKLIRRLISVIGSLSMLDYEKIAVAGWGGDCVIAWQIAGIDKRVKAFVPMLNFGWRDIKELDNTLTEDEIILWDIGCSVQAYAKFVECKTLLIAATNNSVYKYDRIADTLRTLRNKTDFRMLISPQTNEQLYDCSETVLKFVNAVLVSEKQLIASPAAESVVEDGKLNINIRADNALTEVTEIILNYSYNNAPPPYRTWYAQYVGCDMNGKGTAQIKVFDNNSPINYFVTVRYKNKVELSTEPMVVEASALANVTLSPEKKRIIYERKMGLSQFVEEGVGKYITKTVRLVPGAMDILGIATDYPVIKTYRIGEVINDDSESILQMDIYTDLNRIKIGLIDEFGAEHTAESNTDGSGEWQKFQFNVFDFKDSELRSLKSWNLIRVMKIYYADKLLLNNILWV